MAEVKPMFGPDGPQPDQCGLSETREGGPWLVDGGLCGVCRFARQFDDHCFVFERCTDCGNVENPCPVAEAIQGS